MRVFYSILFHDNDRTANYKGCTVSGPLCEAYLLSQGHAVYQADVSEMVNGKKWHEQVIIVRHLKDESLLIDTALLKDLKLEGTKQAEAILKQRRDKKNGKQK